MGMRKLRLWGAAALLAFLAACTDYQTAPGAYTTTPASSFDRSWAAAVGAMGDQGLQITRMDRGAGIVEGVRNGRVVTVNLRTQADGSVRVAFATAGAQDQEPGLLERVSQSYDRRMGR